MPLTLRHKTLFVFFGLIFIVGFLVAVYTETWLPVLFAFAGLFIPVIINKPVLLFYVLLFFLPLSAEYKFSDTLGIDFPDEPLMICLTAVGVFIFAHKPSLFKHIHLKEPLLLLLTVQLIWMLVCTLYSQNVLLSLKYCLAKGWYIVPFVILPTVFIKNKQQLKIASLCLLLPMLFIILQSIYRHAGYNFSFEKVNNVVTPFFRNHVNYGAMLAALLPVVFVFYFTVKKEKRYKNFLVKVIIVFAIGLFLSYSRGAWLAAFFSLAGYWLLKYKLLTNFFVVVSIIIVVAFFGLSADNKYLDYRPDFRKTIFHKNFNEHLAATYRGQDLSTAERFYRWTAAKNMLQQRPLLGVGPNNFYDSYKPFATSAYKTWVSDNREHSTVHNYFFLLVTEQGIPGFVLFWALLFFLFKETEMLFHKTSELLAKAIIAGIACMLTIIITVNFLSDLIETDKIGSLFYLCIGILLIIKNKALALK